MYFNRVNPLLATLLLRHKIICLNHNAFNVIFLPATSEAVVLRKVSGMSSNVCAPCMMQKKRKRVINFF